jgi:hypothetical protein
LWGSGKSKSQLQGVWGLFSFCLSSFSLSGNRTEGLFYLLLSDWTLVVYMLN